MFLMNPAPEAMPRLAKMAAMYRRYRFRYCNISYKSGSGTSTAGNVAIGVCAGPKLDSIKDQGHVMKLRPSIYVPAWKNDSFSMGRDIDTSKFMICEDNTIDGVAFALYVHGTKGVGMVQVSYEVEFSQPHPF